MESFTSLLAERNKKIIWQDKRIDLFFENSQLSRLIYGAVESFFICSSPWESIRLRIALKRERNMSSG